MIKKKKKLWLCVLNIPQLCSCSSTLYCRSYLLKVWDIFFLYHKQLLCFLVMMVRDDDYTWFIFLSTNILSSELVVTNFVIVISESISW